MKIIHIITSMNPITGGPSQVIRNIVPFLNQNNTLNEVVCLDKNTSDYLKLYENKFRIYTIGPAITSLGYNHNLVPWLKKNLLSFDIVIIHGIWQFHNFAVRKVIDELKRKGVKDIPKVCIMPHGGLGSWFQKDKSRRLKSIRNFFYWELIEKRIVKSADAMLFLNELELEQAKSTFRNYQPKQELNIGAGIPNPPSFTFQMNEIVKKKCPKLNTEPYLLFLGRIHSVKGIDILIEAFIMALDNFDKTFLPHLVIAGPGIETPYGQKIYNYVKKHSILQDKIHFLDMVNGDLKWGLIYRCEALILPSHHENFGISIAEALSCGKPVLISNKVNICQKIQENQCGLVEEDTVIGTYKNIEKWINLSIEKKRQMEISSKTTYETFFTIEKGVEDFLKGLKKIISGYKN